jgi:hypothetical protein
MPLDSNVRAGVNAALAAQTVPDDLIERLVESSSDAIDHYISGRMRPSELSGGDFAEATARILQFMLTGSFTPLGRPLPRFDTLMASFVNESGDEALRIHIPRLLTAIYTVRNRRGVGHLPGAISANRGDAELLMTSVKWILAEFLRLFHVGSHEAAQRLVDRLAVRTIPVVEDFEGTLRIVVTQHLSIPDSVLILLRAAGGEVQQADLLSWARAPAGQLRTALTRLDDRNLIHRFPDARIRLTTLGNQRADSLVHSLDDAA